MSTSTPAKLPSTSILSSDIFRALTAAFMILVNNNGDNELAYRALNPSPWKGFTATAWSSRRSSSSWVFRCLLLRRPSVQGQQQQDNAFGYTPSLCSTSLFQFGR
jgi:hypothetical protein